MNLTRQQSQKVHGLEVLLMGLEDLGGGDAGSDETRRLRLEKLGEHLLLYLRGEQIPHDEQRIKDIFDGY